MSLTITPTIFDDLPEITDIYGDHVLSGLASFEYEAPTQQEMVQRYQSLIEQNFPYFTAKYNKKTIGYAYVGPFHPRKAYEKTVEDTIYLMPQAQGQGIGRQLLGQLIKASQERGYHQMIALITVLDSPASIRLHEKLGFQMAGRLKQVGFKHGQWLDVVYMQKSLI